MKGYREITSGPADPPPAPTTPSATVPASFIAQLRSDAAYRTLLEEMLKEGTEVRFDDRLYTITKSYFVHGELCVELEAV